MSEYEASVGQHLSRMLGSEDEETVINSAHFLCPLVRDFLAGIRRAHPSANSQVAAKVPNSQRPCPCTPGPTKHVFECAVLEEKLENLRLTLGRERAAAADAETRAVETDDEDSDDETHRPHLKNLHTKVPFPHLHCDRGHPQSLIDPALRGAGGSDGARGQPEEGGGGHHRHHRARRGRAKRPPRQPKEAQSPPQSPQAPQRPLALQPS